MPLAISLLLSKPLSSGSHRAAGGGQGALLPPSTASEAPLPPAGHTPCPSLRRGLLPKWAVLGSHFMSLGASKGRPGLEPWPATKMTLQPRSRVPRHDATMPTARSSQTIVSSARGTGGTCDCHRLVALAVPSVTLRAVDSKILRENHGPWLAGGTGRGGGIQSQSHPGVSCTLPRPCCRDPVWL